MSQIVSMKVIICLLSIQMNASIVEYVNRMSSRCNHSDTSPKFTQRLYDINKKWSEEWSVITEQKDPLPNADAMNPSKGYAESKENLLDEYD